MLTLRPLRPGQSLRSLFTLRPLRPGQSLRSLGPIGSSRPLGPISTGRALRSLLTLRPLRPGQSLRPLGPIGSGRPLRSLLTLRPLWALGPHRAGVTLQAFGYQPAFTVHLHRHLNAAACQSGQESHGAKVTRPWPP